MLKVYKFRLYPNKEQETFLNKHFGCVRFIYNYLLNKRKESYEEGNPLSSHQAKKLIPPLKQELTWLKEVNSQSLQQACINLDNAFKRFFKKQGSYPQFKKKHNKNAFHIPQHFQILPEQGLIRIPKLKTPIKTIFHRDIENLIKYKSLTISKTPTGKFFVSILVEQEALPVGDLPYKQIGVDLGLKDFLTTSEGEKVKASKFFRKAQKKLRKAQRRLSRKKKASMNRRKQRLLVARLHEKVANQRKDFLHKVSHKLVHENQVIYLEDLNVKGMLKNRRLSKSVSDVGWSEFVRQLKYKAEWYGRRIVQIGRFEPSSQLCSNCGYRYRELKLEERNWSCNSCGERHDRDINAALNILLIGMEDPELTLVERSSSGSARKGLAKSAR
jgi:putative transposase